MVKKLSTWQLALISSGGMLGAGWLFSPFYGYQMAGVGVLCSWVITALITLIIGLSFAEVCSALPMAGGIYRLMGITHPRSVATLFLIIGWLSYVVYLPLEAQAVIQYLGFWLPSLIVDDGTAVELSWRGIGLAMLIILGMTGFNTLVITKVAKANTVISLWKIAIPIGVALIVIASRGQWPTLTGAANFANFSAENVLLAVTSSGLAFAFSGFQNGLLLANQVAHPGRAIPHSLFWPIGIGLVLYALLSLSFLSTLDGDQPALMNAAAPLLGLLSLLGLNVLFTLLFVDAVLAPLGTTNVYVAVTARVLYGIGRFLAPNSVLTRLNRHQVPVAALWINGAVGMLFLFPFPTWKALVNFLSSIVVFAYLAGPVSLWVLRRHAVPVTRRFSLKWPYATALLGFICCTWLIYWSGLANLGYLWLTVSLVLLGYALMQGGVAAIKRDGYLFAYMGALWFVSWLRDESRIAFPLDNLLVGIIGAGFCHVFVRHSLDSVTLRRNIEGAQRELAGFES